MGCYDIYCFLCGNSCHAASIDQQLFLDDIEDYKNKKIKNKWFKKYFEQIYEIYIINPKKFLEKIKNINKNTKWLLKCSFLAANNKIIHGCTENTCNVEFIDKKNNLYIHQPLYESPNEMYGIFVHTDCWKFINKEYNIKLSYSHLPIIKKSPKHISPKSFDFINYGLIENYWNQHFDFIKVITDSNEYLCDSPLKNNLVAKNIKKVFSQLKIRIDINRNGPSVSATFYTNGLYKIGSNGNIWTIKNNKWIELKDTIKKKIVLSFDKEFNKIVYFADVNDKPFFVLKEQINKKNKEYVILTLKNKKN